MLDQTDMPEPSHPSDPSDLALKGRQLNRQTSGTLQFRFCLSFFVDSITADEEVTQRKSTRRPRSLGEHPGLACD